MLPTDTFVQRLPKTKKAPTNLPVSAKMSTIILAVALSLAVYQLAAMKVEMTFVAALFVW